jgi:hypothetical protein
LLGILTFVFTLFLFSVGLAAPDVYSPLALPQIKDDGDHTALEQEVQEDENGAADAEHNTEGDDDDNLKVLDQEPEEELGVVYLSV